MGTNVLSMQERLQEIGFINVLGKKETVGAGGSSTEIKKGVAMTWDTNNGVTVVYDDKGEPWVARGCLDVNDGLIRRGAHVPMSNDGGHGIRQLFPNGPLSV